MPVRSVGINDMEWEGKGMEERGEGVGRERRKEGREGDGRKKRIGKRRTGNEFQTGTKM